MNLLLVDDEIIEIEALEIAIPWRNFGISKVYRSSNILEAKQILSSRQIHIIISDIEMPHGSGLELLDWVQEHYPLIFCILFTCHADFSYAQQAVRSQAFDYLLKPINPPEIQRVITRAIQEISQRTEANGAETSSDSETSAVEKIIRFLKDNPGANPSREELANMVFLNPDYLSRLFKKETGTGLSDYITSVKIEEAKHLLARTTRNIGTIATDLGYSNFSYFSKKFRKETGLSPVEFRNRYYI